MIKWRQCRRHGSCLRTSGINRRRFDWIRRSCWRAWWDKNRKRRWRSWRKLCLCTTKHSRGESKRFIGMKTWKRITTMESRWLAVNETAGSNKCIILIRATRIFRLKKSERNSTWFQFLFVGRCINSIVMQEKDITIYNFSPVCIYQKFNPGPFTPAKRNRQKQNLAILVNLCQENAVLAWC